MALLGRQSTVVDSNIPTVNTPNLPSDGDLMVLLDWPSADSISPTLPTLQTNAAESSSIENGSSLALVRTEQTAYCCSMATDPTGHRVQQAGYRVNPNEGDRSTLQVSPGIAPVPSEYTNVSESLLTPALIRARR